MGPNLSPLIPIRKNYFPQDEDDISEDDTTSSSDDSRENENENENYGLSYLLFTPTLEDLKNVLYVALNPLFEEFEIVVVSCPCLTRAPYNLAAAGLSGNTGILQMGSFYNFCPRPQTDIILDIQDILSKCSYDAFVIGSGFAAKPSMPSNGFLTMNAVVSANHRNVINNSSITYKGANGEFIFEIINDQDQIKCSLFGHFFFSGGKRGPVIKMRAKGRRSRSDIIALIQTALSNRCQNKLLIGLGIVLVINGGQSVQYILPHDFISYDYNQDEFCNDQLRLYVLNCENLIALGALTSHELLTCRDYKKRVILGDVYSMFNTLANIKFGGNFVNDITPEETEYIVYINIAQEKCYKN